MHHSSAAVSGELTKPPPSTAPLQPLLDLITNVLSLLLLSSLTVRSFIGKWQILRSKLFSLHSSLSSLSESPHWSENPLLHTLLPSLLSNLQRLNSLSHQCSSASFSGGKLLMQSDLDIASSSLSTHISDLDLLLRSGVLHQNAIVLSLPASTSDKDDIAFFIRDLFTRLQIGGAEFKKKSLESLLQLLTDSEKSARIVAKEGNVGYLVTLLDLHHHPLIREHALAAVSLLTSSSVDSRKTVYEEGGLGPLLRLLETGSPPLKTRAAVAIEAITVDPETAWAISAYGGVTVLIEACRSGSIEVQEHTAGAISNIAAVDDIRTMLAEEGAVPVLLPFLISGSTSLQEKAANFISLLSSSGEYFRDLIVRERGLQILIHLVQASSNPDTIEHALLALTQLSAIDSVARVLSSSTGFIIQLGEFVKHGNVIVQQISSSLLSKLTISDGNKRAIADCLGSLIRLMESPKPAGLQEAATEAAKLLLTVRSNRKELIRDEKSVIRLVQMLDPRNERMVAKELPVIIVAAILSGGNNAARTKLMSLGADRHLQSLEEMEVSGAKKTLQRLAAGNRLKSIFTRAWKDH
uniref:Vacuolar protein 8 n=1 Tax=Noccaea caerulescens TaxID=107243 RepID=A0A1J3GMD1_NOCCA